MADRPPAKTAPDGQPHQAHKKETADQRRERQKANVISTQIDLKREAAERRAAKAEGLTAARCGAPAAYALLGWRPSIGPPSRCHSRHAAVDDVDDLRARRSAAGGSPRPRPAGRRRR